MKNRCAYCGSTKNLTFFGNPPNHAKVLTGQWPPGHHLCGRCVRIENRRALRRLPSPRLAARVIGALRRLAPG